MARIKLDLDREIGVLDALRALRMPVLRWQGGNFVSGYDLTDGIGPRHERPGRNNLAWRHVLGQPARENGHEEPFGVKNWGPGNEMYGTWQMAAICGWGRAAFRRAGTRGRLGEGAHGLSHADIVASAVVGGPPLPIVFLFQRRIVQGIASTELKD